MEGHDICERIGLIRTANAHPPEYLNYDNSSFDTPTIPNAELLITASANQSSKFMFGFATARPLPFAAEALVYDC
jgi:hypothetical protein